MCDSRYLNVHFVWIIGSFLLGTILTHVRRSYSVGYNVIMAYSSAYTFKFFENCLFIFYLKQKWTKISLDLQDQ